MLLLIFSITLISGTFDLLTSSGTRSVFSIYLMNFVYTSCCSFFCAMLLTLIYSKVEFRHRIIEFLLFFIAVFTGVYLGLLSGHMILAGKLVKVTLLNLIVPLIFGFVASIFMTAYSIIQHRLEEKVARLKVAIQENEQLKRLESEARLASLQAKLDPHFLFNTLNSLAALVYDDPQKTERSIIKLAEVYRSVLSISNQSEVSIEEELRLIRDYLELEKLRFDEQFKYEINCPESLMLQRIPGLLIEPLVSNIIKHGLEYTDKFVNILINIRKKDSLIFIDVIDDGPGFIPEKVSSGYGHISIQERLKLLYSDNYQFLIESAPGQGVSVKLIFPDNIEHVINQEA
ncbi:histidine kinase [bacterium]|nr:histidine kinase [bacterium]